MLLKDKKYLKMMLQEMVYKNPVAKRGRLEQMAETFLKELDAYQWQVSGKGYFAYNGDAVAFTDYKTECISFNDRYFDKDAYERLVTMLHELYHQINHGAGEYETEQWAQEMATYIYNNINRYNDYKNH